MRQARRFTLRQAAHSGLDVVLAVGTVAAASAIIEAALIPGLAIGAAAVMGPRLFANSPRKRAGATRRSTAPPRQATTIQIAKPTTLIERPARSLQLMEASLKTVSFRIIVTILDFGFNYVVLGDIVTSAGLSAFSLVAGPFFYFLHETSWTYLRPLLPADWTQGKAHSRYTVFGFRISHAVAKTITYRLFATVSDFSTNFIFVQNVATAAYLSSFGFFLGPFVYYAHERLWEAIDERSKQRCESSVLAVPPLAIGPTPA